MDNNIELITRMVMEAIDCKDTAVVLNTGTKTGFPQHLDIKIRALRDPLRLDQFIILLKISHPLFHFPFHFRKSRFHTFRCHNIM